jgi:hypothetical protein
MVTGTSSHFLHSQQIVTVTSVLMFEKSGCFRFFVTSRLLKVAVCNDHYQRCNGNDKDVTIKRICSLITADILEQSLSSWPPFSFHIPPIGRYSDHFTFAGEHRYCLLVPFHRQNETISL